MPRKPGTGVCYLCDDCLIAPNCTCWCDKVRDFLVEYWEEESREYTETMRRELEKEE